MEMLWVLANNGTRLYVTRVRKKVPPGIYTLRYSDIASAAEKCRMGIAHQPIIPSSDFDEKFYVINRDRICE